MIPVGCTCKNSFPFPYKKEEVASLYITYQENGKTILEKSLEECSFSDGKISVHLTQEDSLKFCENALIKIQIRSRLTNGAVIKSVVMSSHTDEILKRGAI